MLGTPLDLPVGLAASTIHREHVVAALPADHHLANQPAVDLRELLEEPVAGPAAGVAPEWDRLISGAARDAGTSVQAAPATFGNLATALGVAAEQRYPALLTSDVRHWPLAGVCVIDVQPTIRWDTAVLHLKGSSAQHVRGFLDAALTVATDGTPATAAPAERQCLNFDTSR